MPTATTLLVLLASAARADTLAVCATCSYTTVGAALAAATDGDEITVAAGTWEVGATVDLALTIRGEGAGSTVLQRSAGLGSALQVVEGGALSLEDLTLTGASEGRGLLVDASSATLRRVEVTGGGSGSGAGLYAQAGSSVTLEACSFSDNAAGSDAVGGHLVAIDSTLTATDSSFVGGSAGSGGAIWADGSTVEIIDSSFQDNSASPATGSGYGGGLRFQTGDLSLEGVTFSGNTVSGSGGGGGLSVADAYAELVDCRFEGGAAPAGAGIYVYEAGVTLVDVDLADGSAEVDGGTARGGGLAAFGGEVLLDGCTVTGNGVTGGDFAAGGGLYANSSDLSLVDVLVQDNRVQGTGSVYGGGVYVTGADLVLAGGRVLDNSAEGEGSGVLGGGLYARGEGTVLTLDEVELRGNRASYAGGGLFAWDGSESALGEVRIAGAELAENLAAIGAGAALYTAAAVELSASRFEANVADEVGGGLFWRPGDEGAPAGSLDLADLVVRDNLAGELGGGIYGLYGSRLQLAGTELVGNSAADGGGAYLYAVDQVEVALSTFCGNSATGDDGGGASLNYSGDSTWSNVVLAENRAADNGGAVQIYEPTGTQRFVNDSFLGNETVDNGGGLYVYGTDAVTVGNSLFAWTTGGDAFYASEAVDAEAITYSAWVDNSADHLGGALGAWGTGNVELDDPGLWAYEPGGDCDDFVFAHRPDSALVDAGDPAIVEPDGTTSDIGAFGGAEADPAWLVDSDGDGYPGAVDCDDGDAAVHPGAEEIAWNGVDDDCDGEDLCDVDGDGFDSELCGGEDCNDEDADINPWADDPDADGVDQDCDGSDGPDGDGGATDGGATDGGTGDGGTGDGGTDGGTTDGGGTDGGTLIGDGGAEAGDDKDGGCGCTAGSAGSGLLALALGPLALLRRRRPTAGSPAGR